MRAAGWSEREMKDVLRITYRESRWNPRAINRNDPFGGSYGLFQLNGWWERYGIEEVGEQLNTQLALRPMYNARYARKVYERFGWKPWSTA